MDANERHEIEVTPESVVVRRTSTGVVEEKIFAMLLQIASKLEEAGDPFDGELADGAGTYYSIMSKIANIIRSEAKRAFR